MKKILLVLMVSNVVLLAMSASILDFLTEDPQARDQETKKNCLCNGPSCICCVDFNMSFIDLGGPGCVRMNYISADEGIAINVSYGASMLHSETVRGPDPAPTCLNIFSQIAQMCARFSELLPTDDGLRGCINLEPMLLGSPQLELPIGCFKMGPNGMEIIASRVDAIKEQQPKDENTKQGSNASSDEDDDDDDEQSATNSPTSETIAGYSTADILAAVSDSAEQGIALLSNWFGISPTAAANQTAIDTNEKSDEEEVATTISPDV